MATSLHAATDALAIRLGAASRGGDYRPPAARELAAAERLVDRLARGDLAAAGTLATGLDYQLEAIDEAALHVVAESREARLGRPYFALRDGGDALLLQIPHAFSDEMTREIGLALFRESRARLAMWNTVPRRIDGRAGSVDADMAHLPDNWFNAAAVAFAAAHPRGRIVQLHGFAAGKRKSAVGRDAAIVLSNGTARPGPFLRTATRCLADALRAPVALYPDTIRELGATTNAQVASLRASGFSGFVHVEISREMRERLREDRAARDAVRTCLLQVPAK